VPVADPFLDSVVDILMDEMARRDHFPDRATVKQHVMDSVIAILPRMADELVQESWTIEDILVREG